MFPAFFEPFAVLFFDALVFVVIGSTSRFDIDTLLLNEDGGRYC